MDGEFGGGVEGGEVDWGALDGEFELVGGYPRGYETHEGTMLGRGKWMYDDSKKIGRLAEIAS